MKIGVDCDGVLYHWERTARYMIRREMNEIGDPIPDELYRSSTHWDMIKNVIEPYYWTWLWTDAVRHGLFRYGHVIGGSLEGMRALDSLGKIFIVTSRPPAAVKDTIAWLSLMTDKVDLSGIHILTDGQNKSSIMDLEALDVLIDDGLHNIDDVALNDHAAIIFDQPWNQIKLEDQFDHVYRAYGWREVVETVAMMKRGDV